MKLLQLDLEGFTSFRAPTSIRFDGLELFAICGPTGAGKSSLLDAITFALFGKVERSGADVKSLRSTGAATLGVQLEFGSGGTRYRVTRKLRATGTQKILLERADGDAWIDAGDGADKVKGVEAQIERILGIDYDGFVRTVILPQGEFARFLNGDAAGRRRILSKLLGLEIYERMMKRANAQHLSLKDQATGKNDMLRQAMADATPEALADAEVRLRAATDAYDQLNDRSKLLDELVERDAERAARRTSLTAGIAQLEAYRTRQATLSARNTELTAARASIQPRLAAQRAAAEAARTERLTHEETMRARIETRGDDAQLRSLRDVAVELGRDRITVTELSAARAQGVAALAALEPVIAQTADATTRATGAVAAARDALAAAEEALDQARRADHAASACIGLSAGDPCPVCATPLPDPLPTPSADLQQALSARTAADRTVAETTAGLAAAETEHRSQVATAERYRERLDEIDVALAAAQRRIEAATPLLASTLAEAAADPLEILDAELAERDGLRARVDAARRTEADADALAASVTNEVDGIERELATIATRIEESRAGLRPALSEVVPAELLPDGTLDDAALGNLGGAIRGALADDEAQRAALLAEAVTIVGDASHDTIAAVRAAVEEQRRALDHEIGRLRGRRESIEQQMTLRAQLEVEVGELAAASDRYRAVADELKSNRFVEYLQHDALRNLCLAGSEHLSRLSGGRYRLHYDDGAFAVLDAWSADEARSAKTLSGGETFLASLSLALSLADEIARVRIGDAARLESLFLDEGFGTLDSETLEEVEEALDRLARTGRTIGIITHIKELAERLPVRIQITKHPAGSTAQILG